MVARLTIPECRRHLEDLPLRCIPLVIGLITDVTPQSNWVEYKPIYRQQHYCIWWASVHFLDWVRRHAPEISSFRLCSFVPLKRAYVLTSLREVFHVHAWNKTPVDTLWMPYLFFFWGKLHQQGISYGLKSENMPEVRKPVFVADVWRWFCLWLVL